MTAFTKMNLANVEDMAPKFGMDGTQEARFAGKDLNRRAMRGRRRVDNRCGGTPHRGRRGRHHAPSLDARHHLRRKGP